MLRFSQMQLVVIAVVLILPALQSGVFLSGAVVHYDCEDIVVRRRRVVSSRPYLPEGLRWVSVYGSY
uniref:Putative ixodes 10 kDa peptide protein n=1 Tax=Ixodes ricinus TaxID=34613 RepID=A0A0K8RM86_IXORI